MYDVKNNVYLCNSSKTCFDLSENKIYKLDDLTYDKAIRSGIVEGIEISKEFNEDDYIINGLKINVSQLCNLACEYCYANKGEYKKSGLMDISVAKSIVERLEKVFPNVKTISFFGGEATLNYDIIRYFCKHLIGKKFLIQTNGLLIAEDRFIDLFKKYNFTITLSVDGPKEIHDRFRKTKAGEPSFERIRNNVLILREAGVEIDMIQSTYVDCSVSKNEISQSLYKSLGISNIFISDLMNNDLIDNGITTKREQDCCIELNNITKDNKYFSSFNVMDILSPFLTKKKSKYFCEASRNMVSIDISGDIWPCHLCVGDGVPICNIVKDDETYIKVSILEKAKELHLLNKSNTSYCQNCIARYHCKKCLKKVLDDEFYKSNCLIKQKNTIKCLEWFSNNLELIDKLNDYII